MKENIVEILYKSVYDGKGTQEANKDIEKTKNNVKNAGKETSKLGETLSKAFKIGALAIAGKIIFDTTSKIIEATKKSADYIESLNLLDVAFNNDTKSIREFTSTFAETLNLDEKTLIDAAGHFKVLSQSMNMANETGEKFSKLLTQMTLDVSSLYNIDFDKAQSALQYAVEGRGTSLKQRTGVSVLETTVQTTLDTLGVDAYVEDMNDTEKALARVITMEYQLRNSQGDLARTIEAPANQFRVLGEQIRMVGRNIGNIFLPMVAAILPYVNAVLIVINKLLSALAKLFGFKPTQWDSFEAGASAFDDLGSSIGGVGSAAESTEKKLQGLRSFDKLNVITTTTSGGGGGGAGGGAGGINPDLLNKFNEMFGNYNSMLDGIETKATKIANAIMKELSSFDTSKVEESFRKLWEALKPLQDFSWDALKGFYEYFLKPLATWTLGEGIPRFIDAITNGLYKIDWDYLLTSFNNLWKSLEPFAENVGSGLLWLWENVLVPLGTWVISDVVPAFFNILSGTLDVLNQAIEDIKPIFEWLWESILEPLATWTGGIVVDVLNSIGKALKTISDNEIAMSILEGVAIAIGLITGALALYNVAMTLASVVTGAFGAVMAVVTSPITLITLAIGAVIAVIILLVKHWDEVKEVASNVWNKVKEVWDKVANWFSENVINPVVNFFQELKDKVVKVFKGIIDWVKENWQSIVLFLINPVAGVFKYLYDNFDGFREFVDNFVTNIKNFFQNLWDGIKKIFNNVGDWFKQKFTDALNKIKNVFSPIVTFFGGIWDKIKSKFSTIGTNIGNAVSGAFKTAVNAVLRTLENTLNTPIRAINKMINVINKLPGVNIGTLSTFNLPRLADGGLPDVGQMFIANERGPELVGQIGGKSFVANQNQMMDIIDKKLSSAGGLNNATFVIQVGDEQLAKKVLKDLNGMAKANGKPITISG